MRDRGIVRPQRAGREVRYALVSPIISESCQLVRRALLEEVRTHPPRVRWRRAMAGEIRALRDAESRLGAPIPV